MFSAVELCAPEHPGDHFAEQAIGEFVLLLTLPGKLTMQPTPAPSRTSTPPRAALTCLTSLPLLLPRGPGPGPLCRDSSSALHGTGVRASVLPPAPSSTSVLPVTSTIGPVTAQGPRQNQYSRGHPRPGDQGNGADSREQAPRTWWPPHDYRCIDYSLSLWRCS